MTFAIILSGGTGARLGADIPKQYIEVNGKRIIFYTLGSVIDSDRIDAVIVVADPAYWDIIKNDFSLIEIELEKKKPLFFAYPGATRQLSILSGMLRIKEIGTELKADKDSAADNSRDYVFVHDAARPNLTVRIIDTCLEAAAGHDGVLPVLPMKDTVYMSSDGGKSVSSLLDRSQIFAGQAPETFVFDRYLDANMRLVIGDLAKDENGVLTPDRSSPIYKINGSTEPAIMAGMDIAMIPGDESNFKITTRADLEKFADLIKPGCGR